MVYPDKKLQMGFADLIECIPSSLRIVWSKLRNKLGEEHAKKSFVFRHLDQTEDSNEADAISL